MLSKNAAQFVQLTPKLRQIAQVRNVTTQSKPRKWPKSQINYGYKCATCEAVSTGGNSCKLKVHTQKHHHRIALTRNPSTHPLRALFMD